MKRNFVRSFPLFYVSRASLCGFLFSLWLFEQAKALNTVTYGSGICVKHSHTDYKLFSAKIAWGSGSGQQAVTAIGDEEFDDSVMWYVKEGHDSTTTFGAGHPVSCGAIIRLEHVESDKNLHSHSIKSPISGQNEVSAYGEDGAGNTGDDFKVECLSGTGQWRVNELVAFRHVGLGGYLKASGDLKFNKDNCPRCPIVGHLEIVVGSNSAREGPKADEIWTATDGMILSLSEVAEEDDSADRDEL